DLVRVIRADLLGVPAAKPAPHRVPLGDTGWAVWRDALLRSTGFPASGIDSFAAPDAAAAADAYLDDPQRQEDFDRAFASAVQAGGRTAKELAAHPLLREAV